jgi:hypothetical protein
MRFTSKRKFIEFRNEVVFKSKRVAETRKPDMILLAELADAGDE